ncbi:DNA (cytosine-5-)-methyltransferase, partial [gut metagenome]
SSTTGIAASLTGRRFLGIEREEEYVLMSKQRREELENPEVRLQYRSKIKDLSLIEEGALLFDKNETAYDELPF